MAADLDVYRCFTVISLALAKAGGRVPVTASLGNFTTTLAKSPLCRCSSRMGNTMRNENQKRGCSVFPRDNSKLVYMPTKAGVCVSGGMIIRLYG